MENSAIVINPEGYALDFGAACMYMDRDIVAEIDYMINSDKCSGEQWFFDAYCRLHAEKFGETWELAKANPVW